MRFDPPIDPTRATWRSDRDPDEPNVLPSGLPVLPADIPTHLNWNYAVFKHGDPISFLVIYLTDSMPVSASLRAPLSVPEVHAVIDWLRAQFPAGTVLVHVSEAYVFPRRAALSVRYRYEACYTQVPDIWDGDKALVRAAPLWVPEQLRSQGTW